MRLPHSCAGIYMLLMSYTHLFAYYPPTCISPTSYSHNLHTTLKPHPLLTYFTYQAYLFTYCSQATPTYLHIDPSPLLPPLKSCILAPEIIWPTMPVVLILWLFEAIFTTDRTGGDDFVPSLSPDGLSTQCKAMFFGDDSELGPTGLESVPSRGIDGHWEAGGIRE